MSILADQQIHQWVHWYWAPWRLRHGGYIVSETQAQGRSAEKKLLIITFGFEHFFNRFIELGNGEVVKVYKTIGVSSWWLKP